MAAESIDTFTIDFPANYDSTVDDYQPQRLDGGNAFQLPTTAMGPITTLSSNGAPTGTDVEGLLYVPLLASSDPCNATAQHFIPHNVTSLGNIPSQVNLPFIAIVPWISANCTTSYLNAVNVHAQTDALFVYLSKNVNASSFANANPPNSTDPAWQINGSTNWTSQYNFPVYAINSDNGNLIVQSLAQYSGNITKAPDGTQLGQEFGTNTIARLYTSVDNGTTNTLPSLWVFLLIVLGLLLGMIGLTSISMHLLQRRRRSELRQQVASGQVDLESLGIKRLKVPKEILDKLPLLVYVDDESTNGVQRETTNANPNEPANRNSSGAANHSPASSIDIAKDAAGGSTAIAETTEDVQANLPPASTLPRAKLDFAQPSCPICLDDFVTEQSIIRQLPCKHVFHPACIDPVLTEYSSLCPICKGKVLPTGYTPEITNAMVRRVRGVRAIRRIEALSRDDPNAGHIMNEIGMMPARRNGRTQINLRQQSGPGANSQHPATTTSGTSGPSARERAGSLARHMFRRTAGPSGGAAQDVEMAPVGSPAALAPSRTEARPANVSREEWARRRAEDIFSQPVAAAEASREAQEAARRPKWRRALGTVFPVLA